MKSNSQLAIDLESFAVFNADFPDDSSEDTDGNIVTAAGQNIMVAICDQVGSTGRVVTRPKQYSFYGWACSFYIENIQIKLLLQKPGPWLLMIESKAPWLTESKTKSEALGQGVAIAHEALAAERRIKDLRWMTRAAFEQLKRRES